MAITEKNYFYFQKCAETGFCYLLLLPS